MSLGDDRQGRFLVYIVECADGTLYTGFTNDLERRLRAHNEGGRAGAKYTRARRPVKLVYFEEFAERGLAQKREYEIKQLTRREKLELIGGGGKKEGALMREGEELVGGGER